MSLALIALLEPVPGDHEVIDLPDRQRQVVGVVVEDPPYLPNRLAGLPVRVPALEVALIVAEIVEFRAGTENVVSGLGDAEAIVYFPLVKLGSKRFERAEDPGQPHQRMRIPWWHGFRARARNRQRKGLRAHDPPLVTVLSAMSLSRSERLYRTRLPRNRTCGKPSRTRRKSDCREMLPRYSSASALLRSSTDDLQDEVTDDLRPESSVRCWAPSLWA
jgi:hypothetical protein